MGPVVDGPVFAQSGPWRRSLYSTEMAASTNDGSEEIGDEAAAESSVETPDKKSSPAADILSSPSFLAKKLDVLKSDIAVIDEKIDAANLEYEAGKAEWGTQIDNLKKEYSNI